jgi:hypothetical protein
VALKANSQLIFLSLPNLFSTCRVNGAPKTYFNNPNSQTCSTAVISALSLPCMQAQVFAPLMALLSPSLACPANVTDFCLVCLVWLACLTTSHLLALCHFGILSLTPCHPPFSVACVLGCSMDGSTPLFGDLCNISFTCPILSHLHPSVTIPFPYSRDCLRLL